MNLSSSLQLLLVEKLAFSIHAACSRPSAWASSVNFFTYGMVLGLVALGIGCALEIRLVMGYRTNGLGESIGGFR